MSFLDNLKEEASFTETLNGAKTHSTSGDACLDLFAVAGGMRHRSYRDQIHLFDRAYIEKSRAGNEAPFLYPRYPGGTWRA